MTIFPPQAIRPSGRIPHTIPGPTLRLVKTPSGGVGNSRGKSLLCQQLIVPLSVSPQE